MCSFIYKHKSRKKIEIIFYTRDMYKNYEQFLIQYEMTTALHDIL